MAGDNKKSLKTAVFEFYQLNNEKGKVYTWKHFKKGGVHKTTLYRWLEKIDKTGSVKKNLDLALENQMLCPKQFRES